MKRFLVLLLLPSLTWATSYEVQFMVTTRGYVSVGVFDSSNVLKRTLQSGLLMEAGTHSLYWDGLDRHGAAVDTGTYTWRALITPGFTAEYLFSVGTNSPTKYDHWIGNNVPPESACSDGTDLFAGSQGEGVPAVGSWSLGGTTENWTNDIRAAGGSVSAIDTVGSYLFELWTNAYDGYELELYKVTKSTGVSVGNSSNLHSGSEVVPVDMSTDGSLAAVAFEDDNTIKWYDVSTDTPDFSNDYTCSGLTDLKGVVMKTDGTTYMIEDGKVTSITTGCVQADVISSNLTSPYRLTLDESTGDFYVTDGDQIKRFNSNGTLDTDFDTDGIFGATRTEGTYTAAQFDNISDIEDDTSSGFIVTEGGSLDGSKGASLRRISHWNSSGTLQNEWFGGQEIYTHAVFDPGQEDDVYFGCGKFDICRADMDFTNNDWSMGAVYFYQQWGDGLFTVSNDEQPYFQDHNTQFHVWRHNGEIYISTNNSASVQVMRITGDALTPVAVCGNHSDRTSTTWRAAMTANALDPDTDPTSYCWYDTDGDGAFDNNEWALGDAEPFSDAFQSGDLYHISTDGDFWLPNSYDDQYNAKAWVKITNQRASWATAVAPEWDLVDDATAGPSLPTEWQNAGSGMMRDIYVDADSSVYMFGCTERYGGDDRHGKSWPAYRCGLNRLYKWKSDNTLLYEIGKHAWNGENYGYNRYELTHENAEAWSEPAQILGEIDVTVEAVANKAIVVSERSGHFTRVWDENGLYAGYIMLKRANDHIPEFVYYDGAHPYVSPQIVGMLASDAQAGGSIYDTGSNVYYIPDSVNTNPVYKITGWTGWDAETDTINVASTPTAAAGTGTGLSCTFYDDIALTEPPNGTQIEDQIWMGQAAENRVYKDWSGGPYAGIIATDPFSIRCIGSIEAPFDEVFTFTAYNKSNSSLTENDWEADFGGMRMYLNGKPIIDNWSAPADLDELSSSAVPMTAGTKYDVVLEYYSNGGVGNEPDWSLNWYSQTWERRRVAQKYLYTNRGTKRKSFVIQ